MFERGHATAFLQKPFEGQPMLKLVRDLLDPRRELTPRGRRRSDELERGM